MNNRRGFTIVELLTSITIIALLIGLLLPSLAMIRRSAKEAAQKAQITTIETALDAFKQDYGDYPPSDWPVFPPPFGYCGAQKLAEAMVGWDLMGFHPKTGWRADGLDASLGRTSYDPPPRTRFTPSGEPETLLERKGPYLEVATTNVFKLGDLFNFSAYSPANPLAPNTYVICDVFGVRKLKDATGKNIKAGAPILYYKANTSSKTIDPNVIPQPNLQDRIYDYRHNDPLIRLRKLTANGNPGLSHPLGYSVMNDYQVFYNDRFNYAPGTTFGGSGIGYGIRDPKITQNVWPYRPDSYILISAGYDGFYGTADDIHNF
jgi:prepilin-type N-terminal cleavage/methylation domain-containing protein